jgi:hypothetical protein
MGLAEHSSQRSNTELSPAHGIPEGFLFSLLGKAITPL